MKITQIDMNFSTYLKRVQFYLLCMPIATGERFVSSFSFQVFLKFQLCCFVHQYIEEILQGFLHHHFHEGIDFSFKNHIGFGFIG